VSLAPPNSTLFPYTTLFRSRRRAVHGAAVVPHHHVARAPAMAEHETLLRRVRHEALEQRVALRPAHAGEMRHVPADVQDVAPGRSEEHTSELQSRVDLVCRL